MLYEMLHEQQLV